jgi:hypothetical protein
MMHSYAQQIVGGTEIPTALVPESSTKLMQCRTNKMQITPVNANTCSDGGFLQWGLGFGNGRGFLQPGTLALGFTVTGATTNAADTLNFSFPTKNASALIDRVTVSVGGSVVEQVSNYNVFNSILLSHATSTDYVNFDSTVTEKSGVTFTAAGSSFNTAVIMPLNVGSLSSEKALPLFLLNTALQIQIQFATAAIGFTNLVGAAACTSYTISNPVLYYTEIDTDMGYYELIKSGMMAGKMYSVMFDGILGQSVSHAIASTLSHTTGLSLASCTAVFQTEILTANLVGDGVKLFTKNGQTNAVLYVDGNRVNPYSLDTDEKNFYSIQDTIGNFTDSNITSLCTNVTYPTTYYARGWNLRRSKASNFSHAGMIVNQTRLELTGATAAGTTYIFTMYSGELLIDANGNVAVSK